MKPIQRNLVEFKKRFVMKNVDVLHCSVRANSIEVSFELPVMEYVIAFQSPVHGNSVEIKMILSFNVNSVEIGNVSPAHEKLDVLSLDLSVKDDASELKRLVSVTENVVVLQLSILRSVSELKKLVPVMDNVVVLQSLVLRNASELKKLVSVMKNVVVLQS